MSQTPPSPSLDLYCSTGKIGPAEVAAKVVYSQEGVALGVLNIESRPPQSFTASGQIWERNLPSADESILLHVEHHLEDVLRVARVQNVLWVGGLQCPSPRVVH